MSNQESGGQTTLMILNKLTILMNKQGLIRKRRFNPICLQFALENKSSHLQPSFSIEWKTIRGSDGRRKGF